MKLILSSCDFGNPKSAKFINDNLGMPIETCKVLYFPNEKATEDKIKSGKYEKRLLKYGFLPKNIYVFDYWDSYRFFDIKVDAVYISGGNTFGTLKRIRETGADKLLINLVKSGAIYIGGSAGAHIASTNIEHVAKYDEDTFGFSDFSGLCLYGGIFICHYDEKRREDYEHLKGDGKYHIIHLRDDESILVEDNTYKKLS